MVRFMVPTHVDATFSDPHKVLPSSKRADSVLPSSSPHLR